MRHMEVLGQEIETALGAPKTVDPLLAAKRDRGLRFMVDASPGQSLAEIGAAFRALSARFDVRPLFPEALFGAPDPDEEPRWHALAFVAAIYGITFEDVSANPWDIARSVRRGGGFQRVIPDIPIAAYQAPVEEAPVDEADASDMPGPGWEHVTMRIDEAWKHIRASHPDRPHPLGSNVRIAHPDTGWTAHPVWGPGQPNLDLANSRNFIPREVVTDARDPLEGGFPLSPGHGTGTASVMVAPVGRPVVGVAPNAMLVPIRCVSSVILYPGQIELVQAIRYGQRWPIISISLGMPNYFEFPSLLHPWLHESLLDAVRNNVIVIAAAGQPYPLPRPLGMTTCYPAAHRECIAVAGVEGHRTSNPRNDYRPWDYSLRGNPDGIGRITISAPAFQVYRAGASRDGFTYGNSEGTSYSTAFMAGIAALWLSHHFAGRYQPQGGLSAQECFRRHVQRTAVKPPGFDPWFYGMVNAVALMQTGPFLAEDAAADEAVLDAGPVWHMVTAALSAAQDDPQAGELDDWMGEIGQLLVADPDRAAAMDGLITAGRVTATALRDLLAPVASQSLGQALAKAAAAKILVDA